MKTITGFTPFHFQAKSITNGISLLETKNSLLLASDTGLGKTIVAATIAANMNPEKVLVVSPKANQKAWQNIMDKSGLSYELSGNRAIPAYNSKFDFIIIDEAHKIGTATSGTFLSLFKLIKYNQSKLILVTATPYNNNMESFIDLLTLFNFPALSLERTLIDNFGKLVNEYNYALDGFKYSEPSFRDITKITELEFKKIRAIEGISYALNGFTIRDQRNKIEILPTEHLLERFPSINRVELQGVNPEVKPLIETVKTLKGLTFAWQNQLNYFVPNIDNQFGGIYKTTLFKLLESSLNAFLSSINNTITNIQNALDKGKVTIGEVEYELTEAFKSDLGKDLSAFNHINAIWENKSLSDKMDVLFDTIEKSDGKFVVFTEYVETLNMLSMEAKRRNIPFIEFKSETNENVLDVITNEFDANNHKSDKFKLLICNDVLAEGVSLHYATHLVHFDSRWNPSRTIQREGRINRIRMDGNVHDINIYSFTVPYYIDSEIKLTDKIDRKLSEAELIFTKLGQKENPYVFSLDKIVLKEPNQGVVDTVQFAHFVSDKEFIVLESEGGFIYSNRINNFYPIKNDGTKVIYAIPRYMNVGDSLCPTNEFNSLSGFLEAANEYPKDNRFSGLCLTYNIISDTPLINKSRRPIINERNTMLNHMKARNLNVEKYVIRKAREITLHSTFSYPILRVWVELKKKCKTLEDFEQAFKDFYDVFKNMEYTEKIIYVSLLD